MSGEGVIAEPRSVHVGVGSTRLKELMHRGTEFLGCELAVLGGAMSWVSERNLVSRDQQCRRLRCDRLRGDGAQELLDIEIAETKKRTTKPFGVRKRSRKELNLRH